MALILLLIGLIYVGTLFTAPALQKAGVAPSKTYIPFINTMELVKATGRPIYQAFLVYLPIFNFFLLFSFFTDLSRSFGKDSFLDYIKSMIITPFHFWQASKNAYRGKTSDLPKQKKSTAREWSDSIIFAVLAATLIRWSSFEAFTIPTSSMDSTLKVGDYLFVSKLHYGPRSPITPLQLPLTHQNIWFTGNPDGTGGISSYLDWIRLPYFRLPGLTKIERNDIVVFNWPWDNGKDTYAKFLKLRKENLRPTDLKTNYVKRCVAIPGDTLKILGDDIIINGKKSEINGIMQFSYSVEIDSAYYAKKYGAINYNNDPRTIISKVSKIIVKKCDKYGARTEGSDGVTRFPAFPRDFNGNIKSLASFSVNLTKQQVQEFKKDKLFKAVERINYKKGESIGQNLYPLEKAWTLDDYGPIIMPKKGMTFKVTKDKLIMWERALTYFEGDDVKLKNNLSELHVNGKKVEEYTFRQNYYYMVGDNRHGSYDSRTWAFVPEDHVVGTPLLIWMSIDDTPNKPLTERIRWDRIFNFVR